MALLDITLGGSIGANFHCGYPAYKARVPQLVAIANDMGLGLLRDDNPEAAKILRAAGWKGRVITVCGSAAAAQTAVSCGTDFIDPVNEIATSGEGLTAGLKTLGAIYQTVAGRVPILATSLANPSAANAKAVGTQAGARRANVHCYRGMLPQDKWRERVRSSIAAGQTQAPFMPTLITETGWHNYRVPGKPDNYAGPENSGHVMTPDDVAATQLVPDLLGFFQAGAEMVLYYELIDQWRFRPIDGKADHEGRFGLLNEDMSFKAQTVQLKAFLAQFGAMTLTASMSAVTDHLSINLDLQNQLDTQKRSNALKDATITTLQQQITQAHGLLVQATGTLAGSVTNAPGQ